MSPHTKKAVKLSKHKFRKLKKQAFERDGYRCQICSWLSCNSHEYQLHPHHIILTSRIRLDVLENLETVCIVCHRHLHNGTSPISIEDLIEKHSGRLEPWLDWNRIGE